MSDSPDENQPEFFSELVGEGKKYKDPENLAKAYVHADKYIQSLETQTEELRTELEKRMALEDFIKKTKDDNKAIEETAERDQSSGAPAEATTPVEEAPKTSSGVDESELLKRLKAELEAEDQQKKAQSNISRVEEALLSKYGDEDKVNQAINEKAQEIGVSTDFLKDVATKSPDGFFKLVGLEPSKKSANPLTNGVNTAGLKPAEESSTQPRPGTKAYFDQIRAEDKRRYLSREVQLQMHKAAMENPEEFFGS
jgi:hypothetical protein